MLLIIFIISLMQTQSGLVEINIDGVSAEVAEITFPLAQDPIVIYVKLNQIFSDGFEGGD